MKVESGKYYVTKSGFRIGPMRRFDDEYFSADGDGQNRLWDSSGRRYMLWDGFRDTLAAEADGLTHKEPER